MLTWHSPSWPSLGSPTFGVSQVKGTEELVVLAELLAHGVTGGIGPEMWVSRLSGALPTRTRAWLRALGSLF